MFLRRLILVLVLLAAQMAAGVHALEHIVEQADGHPPGQTCSVCLAAHDLTTTLTGDNPPPPVPTATHALPAFALAASITAPAPLARQRGPPKHLMS